MFTFVDAGNDLDSQKDVPGEPGKLLKSGSGYSIGGGVRVKTPIVPLRLYVASKNLSGNWRYDLDQNGNFNHKNKLSYYLNFNFNELFNRSTKLIKIHLGRANMNNLNDLIVL